MNRFNRLLDACTFKSLFLLLAASVGCLAVTPAAAEAACSYGLDDGRGAADLGHAGKGTHYFVVANWFPVTAGCEKINSITVYWAGGTEFPVGHPIKLYLYEDPTGLGNPAQAVKKFGPLERFRPPGESTSYPLVPGINLRTAFLVVMQVQTYVDPACTAPSDCTATIIRADDRIFPATPKHSWGQVFTEYSSDPLPSVVAHDVSQYGDADPSDVLSLSLNQSGPLGPGEHPVTVTIDDGAATASCEQAGQYELLPIAAGAAERRWGGHAVNCRSQRKKKGRIVAMRLSPEFVAKDKDGNVLGMGYARLTSVAVEAIKQLKSEKDAEIASLRAETDGQIAELSEGLATLEALLAERTGK